jgi:hypothetical protein
MFFASTAGKSLPALAPIDRGLRLNTSDIGISPAHSLFTSDLWWQVAEDVWKHKPAYLRARSYTSPEGCTVLIGQGKLSRQFGLVRVRRLAFNEFVDDGLDDVTIEFNRFRGTFEIPFERSLNWLLDELDGRRDWDEIFFSRVVDPEFEVLKRTAKRRGWGWYLQDTLEGFRVNLASVRATHQGNFLASISTNSREQIRRSRRFCEKQYGPLRVVLASSSAQAEQFLNELAVLHRARWNSGEFQDDPTKGFANPDFFEFQRQLVLRGFASNQVELLKVCAGDHALAYLYNFKSGPEVHFYMSGVNYDIDSKARPGIVAHSSVIEHYLAQPDLVSYDFLAGASRYKESLSNERYRMTCVVMQRPGLILAAERQLRNIKRKHFSKNTVAPRDSHD